MQNFNHSGQNNQQPSQQKGPQQPKQPTSALSKAISNLDVIGAVIMLISLFLGSFYKSDGGVYSAWVIPGYKLIFNSDYMLGTLLVLIPIVLLVVHYVDNFKKYRNLINLVGFVITLMFVFVAKGQFSTLEDGSVGFAMGAFVYVIGNLIGLIGAGTTFFGYDLNGEINKRVNK